MAALVQWRAFHGLFINPAATGEDTPHGQAKQRILKGIARRMKANADAIRGLDIGKPLLPQFDLLTDEQIREVMRSMDPLAASGA